MEVEDVEDALYYLLKIGAAKIEGGFLVIYQTMRIECLKRGNKAQYKKEHYTKLNEYYQNKRQQIHIVGEYAKRLIEDTREAMIFVDDYFVMDYKLFLRKYFAGRGKEISQNITPKKFRQLFGELSPAQLGIINDQKSSTIVVAAGPGSGKTKLLVHKLASLYMMEDVKHEQMLMLTFSRAAATEFKLRLMALMGNAAHYIQITTFHSYCFDLLGRVGDIEKSDTIIDQTVSQINAGEVDLTRLTKTVLVIDEAQDMSAAEYSLVKALMDHNSDMRVIAVGDDDQNIYAFRGSNSAHFESLLDEPGAKKYELIDNYRGGANLVDFANQFAAMISHRFKTRPITPKTEEDGTITVCKLSSSHIVIPVVDAVLKSKPTGSTCVITRKNEEALNITGLLRQEGVTARLIQSNSDFNLYNLVEPRYFSDCVGAHEESYTISHEVWEKAKTNLMEKFGQSDALPGVLKLLEDFEKTRNKTKYKSDFRQFIRESKLEDFVAKSESAVFVSTIHQTKGREFDNVFLALGGSLQMDDETMRAVYVAITRAKRNLCIFCHANCFDNIQTRNVRRMSDDNDYSTPSRICLPLSHTDVFLSYCAHSRREIDSLVSGQELSVRDTGCFWGDREVVRFSNAFLEKIESRKASGYYPTKANIRHIVFWQGKDRDDEIKIVLPNVEFAKE